MIAVDQNFFPPYLDLGKIFALAKKEKIHLILSSLYLRISAIAVQVKRIVLRIELISLGFLIVINAFQNQVYHGDTAVTEGDFL